jgi:DNA-binding transcriptional ArsR family regulator
MSAPPPRVIDAALAVRRRLLRAADAVLPPFASLFDRTIGILRTHVLATLAELGVPAALAPGPLSLAELAERVGADPDALHRVLRVAELDGIVKRDRRGRHKLTRLGRGLIPDRPGSLDPWVRYLVLESTRAAYAALPESVRTGQPGFRIARGTTVWDWYADHPDEEALFAAAMRNITAFDAPDIAAAGLWPDTGTVCDIAGGTGELLSAIVSGRPGLQGVLVDVPGVLEAARARLAGSERISFAAGDLFGSIDVAADVYVLKNILHDWDDATSVRIVETVRRAMAPGARLVVIEQIQERDTPHPFASPTDIQMLTQTDGGRERSPLELQELLRSAGLRPGRVERAGVNALVEANA